MDGAMVTQWRRRWKMQWSDTNGSDGHHDFDGINGWHDVDGNGQRDRAMAMDGDTAMDMKNTTIN